MNANSTRLRRITRLLVRRLYLTAAIGLLAIACSGCTVGVLYTHVIEPFDLNMEETAVGTRVAKAEGITELVEPFTGAQVTVQLFSNALGDIFEANNLNRAEYIDIERKSVFFGIYKQYTLRVSGD